MPRTSNLSNETLPKEEEHYCVIVQESVTDGNKCKSKAKPARKSIKILVPKLWRLDTTQNTLLITSETRETMKIIFSDYPKIKIVYNEEFVPELIGGKKFHQENVRIYSAKECDGCVDSFKNESSRLSWEDPIVLKYSSKQKEKQLLLFRFPPDFLDQRHNDAKWSTLFKSLLEKVSNRNDLIFLVLDPGAVTHPLGFPQLQKEADTGQSGTAGDIENAPMSEISKEVVEVQPKQLRSSCQTDNLSKFSQRKRRLQRPKQSRTAIKSQSLVKLLSPEFRRFFRQYASTGSPLKSGAAITRSNSNFWLHTSGLLTDPESTRLASTLFIAVAGSKVVLGIFDYLRFLMLFARQKQSILAELVLQMIEEGKQHFVFRKRTHAVCESIKPLAARKGYTQKSASLPNLLKTLGETELFQDYTQPKDEQKSRGSYNGIF